MTLIQLYITGVTIVQVVLSEYKYNHTKRVTGECQWYVVSPKENIHILVPRIDVFGNLVTWIKGNIKLTIRPLNVSNVKRLSTLRYVYEYCNKLNVNLNNLNIKRVQFNNIMGYGNLTNVNLTNHKTIYLIMVVHGIMFYHQVLENVYRN